MNARLAAALGAGFLFLLGTTPLRAEDFHVEWDKAFPTRSAPENVYFRARYSDHGGNNHQLQVWRQADVRLRRTTDNAIDLYVEKDAHGDYAYEVVDHARQVIINADRTTLYRIGTYSDWLGLAHVLNTPRGGYRIEQSANAPNVTPNGECRWYRLDTELPSSHANEICWSERWGLPLEIRVRTDADAWVTRFTIEEVRAFDPDPNIFKAENGFLHIDATPDEEPFD